MSDNESKGTLDLSKVEVLPELPSYVASGRGRPFPKELDGCIIVAIGTLPPGEDGWGMIEGGGLVIDYRKPKGKKVRRIVLAFNDEGLWVDFQGSLPETPNRA
jgi:hypothetical protein